MKKVGIVTSNTSFANNYGAVLQCYALSEQLKKWGFSPYVINYSYLNDGALLSTDTKRNKSFLGKIKYLFTTDVSFFQKLQYRTMRKRRLSMIQKFKEFYQKYLTFNSNLPQTYETLLENPPLYEYFITGSDQVWNPVIHGNINDPGCFLQFAPIGAKRIAYAPSFGIVDYPKSLNSTLKVYLETFDHISVREKEGQNIIREAYGIETQIVLDPTLMADPDVYDKISKLNVDMPKHYILCYRFGKIKYFNNYVKKISKIMNLPVIELPLSISSYAKGTKLCYNIDPSQFIGAIKGADLVLTDSFHCTVFSILNNRPFYTFLRQSSNEKNNMNGRVVELLRKLGLSDRLVTPETEIMLDKVLAVDFEKSNELLSKEREMSQEFLKTSLEMD